MSRKNNFIKHLISLRVSEGRIKRNKTLNKGLLIRSATPLFGVLNEKCPVVPWLGRDAEWNIPVCVKEQFAYDFVQN